MSVLIGIPHLGTVTAPTVLSLVGLIGATSGPIRVAMQQGPFVHENRTRLVHMAQESGAEHLFFLDADIQCPEDTIERLRSQDKPIVGANYRTREAHPVSTVKMLVETAGEDLPKAPFRCQAIGTGCLLIKTAVFDRIAKPWFDFCRDDEGMVVVGEDVWFCQQAHAAGYEIWCDPTLNVAHWGLRGH